MSFRIIITFLFAMLVTMTFCQKRWNTELSGGLMNQGLRYSLGVNYQIEDVLFGVGLQNVARGQWSRPGGYANGYYTFAQGKATRAAVGLVHFMRTFEPVNGGARIWNQESYVSQRLSYEINDRIVLHMQLGYGLLTRRFKVDDEWKSTLGHGGQFMFSLSHGW